MGYLIYKGIPLLGGRIPTTSSILEGVVGDGETDDSAALTTALNKSNIVIDGYNKQYKIKYLKISDQHDLTLKNFIFVKGINIKLENCENILFENCIWKDFNDNGEIDARVEGIILASNEIVLDDTNRWGYNTICKNITFDKCRFENIYYAEHWSKYDNSNPSGNRPHYSTGMAIQLEGVDGLKISNCEFKQIKGNACIQANTHGWLGDFNIHDNLFYLNGWGGIELYRCNIINSNKRRTIHHNRFIGCGLGFIPKTYFDTYFPTEASKLETGVGTAALIGTNNPLYNDEGYNADTNRCTPICEVSDNIFIDNNESSVEGSSWNPVLRNYIVGQGAFQTEANRQECISKYNIDYFTMVRVNPSCNALYSSGREHDERDEPYIYRDNIMSRLEGTKGVQNPVMFAGIRKKPFVYENNIAYTLEGEDKWSLINKADFQDGFTWQNNQGLPPYFNSSVIRKNYKIDDIKDIYNCTFEGDSYFETPENSTRFPQVSMTKYEENKCKFRNNEVAAVQNDNVVLSYKQLDNVVEPFGTPIYSINNSPRYDSNVGGIEFNGSNGIDTGVSLFDSNKDFTIIAQYKFNNICNHNTGSPIIQYPNFTFIPVLSCLNYNDSANFYPGFDLGLLFNNASDETSFGGFQCLRNHWKFGGWSQLTGSTDYSTFYNRTYTYIIIKKNDTIICYDLTLKRKGEITGKRATSIFNGTLCIGKNMVAPKFKDEAWGTDEQFSGTVYQCDIYNYAISSASLEAVYPTLNDTEASLKGAVSYYLQNKLYNKHTVRAVCVEMSYDLGAYGKEEYSNDIPSAFEIRLTGAAEGFIRVPASEKGHLKKTIPLKSYTDNIQPFGTYEIQVVNAAKIEDLKVVIKSFKATAITRMYDIEEAADEVNDFDVVWDKDIINLAIGDSTTGNVIFYPSGVTINKNIKVSVDDASVIQAQTTGNGIRLLTLKEGSAICKVSYGEIEKLYNIEVIDRLVPCTGLTLTPSEVTVFVNKQAVITPVRTPNNCNEQIEWSIDNSSVCEIRNGLIVGLQRGECVITAVCGNQTARANVRVNENIIPSESPFDISSIVGYIPLSEISTTHTMMVELDTENWQQNNTAIKNVITTKAGNETTGLGMLTVAIPVASTNNNMLIRDYFDQNASTITATTGSVERKQYYNGKDYNCIIANNTTIRHRYTSNNTWTSASWNTSNGAITKFNNVLYVNAASDNGSNPDIKNYSATELSAALANSSLIPTISNGGVTIKNFIVFANKSYNTYEDIIANRNNAEIDIRLGLDGKLHNFGTSGEIVYANIS